MIALPDRNRDHVRDTASVTVPAPSHTVETNNATPQDLPDYDPESFRQQILEISTEDLQLIWEDQQDLYTEAELKVIKEILTSRQ